MKKITVIYAVGDRYHITGNEEVFQITMDYEEYKIWRNRREIIEMNSWKAE